MPKLTPYPARETAFFDWGWRTMSPMFRGGAYPEPHRRHFGVLHVFNQGTIQPNQGYPMHPHENMEIVTIPIQGQWEHQDTQGNLIHFGAGEVQVMSAGTGMAHSEFNASATEPLTTMQFWLHTNAPNTPPRYEWYRYAERMRPNTFTPVVQPLYGPAGEHHAEAGARILQNAWFNIGQFDQNAPIAYQLHNPAHGVFAYVLGGELELEGVPMGPKDALGIENSAVVNGRALSASARLLLVEVPMQ